MQRTCSKNSREISLFVSDPLKKRKPKEIRVDPDAHANVLLAMSANVLGVPKQTLGNIVMKNKSDLTPISVPLCGTIEDTGVKSGAILEIWPKLEAGRGFHTQNQRSQMFSSAKDISYKIIKKIDVKFDPKSKKIEVLPPKEEMLVNNKIIYFPGLSPNENKSIEKLYKDLVIKGIDYNEMKYRIECALQDIFKKRAELNAENKALKSKMELLKLDMQRKKAQKLAKRSKKNILKRSLKKNAEPNKQKKNFGGFQKGFLL